MSSNTAQQTKLDLELVPKEKRLDIRKYNGRLNPGKIYREPTFQVVLDALASHHATLHSPSLFVSTKEVTQIYGAILHESLTIPEMKETKAYQIYLGKSKRVKRPAKKSTQAPARGVVIRETPEILVSKKKEKVDVVRGKGIELLSNVALK
ncbi:hypothetical protein Tco_0282706 [Tanacetum coccineum]